MTDSKSGLLSIRSMELKVNLGWRNKELMDPQSVLLDFDIAFPQLPDACHTDQLQDTFCYAEIIEKIVAHLGDKKFRLLEHLSKTIYEFMLPHLPQGTALRVSVTKKPKIAGLLGGVSFAYFDNKNKGHSSW